MSIDARVSSVIVNPDGSGELRLTDRPPDGCKGQSTLAFDSAPKCVKKLKGKDLWGGSHRYRWRRVPNYFNPRTDFSGWPIECVRGRPITNAARIAVQLLRKWLHLYVAA